MVMRLGLGGRKYGGVTAEDEQRWAAEKSGDSWKRGKKNKESMREKRGDRKEPKEMRVLERKVLPMTISICKLW